MPAARPMTDTRDRVGDILTWAHRCTSPLITITTTKFTPEQWVHVEENCTVHTTERAIVDNKTIVFSSFFRIIAIGDFVKEKRLRKTYVLQWDLEDQPLKTLIVDTIQMNDPCPPTNSYHLLLRHQREDITSSTGKPSAHPRIRVITPYQWRAQRLS